MSRRFFSLTAVVMLVASSLMIGINVQVPEAAAIQTHNVGNVDLEMVTAYGRILGSLNWNGQHQAVEDPGTGGMGFIGLVIDHDGYNHSTPANISDSYSSYDPFIFYSDEDDFDEISAQDWLINDGVTQKSFGSFQNKGVLTGDPNDLFINQTVWTLLDKDWAIIQWALYNIKGAQINNLSIGLEVPLSFAGKSGGVGGDSGDDIDGFDATNNTYWAQDDGGTTIGFASAITTEPITHYFSENGSSFASFDEFKYAYENETWLYERITATNQVVGTTPGNRITTVGWDGITIDVGSVKTVTLVIAVNDSHDNMIAAVQDAQYYYDFVASGFDITEFNDADTAPNPQKIEVYNNGRGETDLYAAGYRIFVEGVMLTQDSSYWNPSIVPTYDYTVFGGHVDPLRHDRGQAIQVILVVADVDDDGRCSHIATVGFDELEAGDEEILLAVVLFFGVFDLAENVRGVVSSPDKLTGQIGTQRAENVATVVVLTGGVVALVGGYRIVVYEIPLSHNLSRVIRVVEGFVGRPKPGVQHTDDNPLAGEARFVQGNEIDE